MSETTDNYIHLPQTILKEVNDARMNTSNNNNTLTSEKFLSMPDKKLHQLNSPEIRCSPSPCLFDFDGNIRTCGGKYLLFSKKIEVSEVASSTIIFKKKTIALECSSDAQI